ncbi:MAG TPA: sigma-70 family RNA polymerase sigma factor [Streptosporangiaceae bacterium]|jgi:RNA polymerase sigma-70 factor (ECF subfamily)
MADSDALAAAFEEDRARLRAVAYRLLGSATDAEDAVQETWLRLAGTDVTEVGNLGGWLTTVVARVSLNMLRSRRHRSEQPVGDSWPEAPAAAAPAGLGGAAPVADPEFEAVLADSVGLALMVVLDTLTPAERLAFVLHDTFAMPFAEVAAILGRSPEATRQLASRARRQVRGAPSPELAGDLPRQREVAEAFLAASRGGDLSALIAVLDADAVLRSDAAASPAGRPAELHGAAAIARGAAAAAARSEQSVLALVDGAVGIVFAPGGRLQVALALTSSGGRITAIDVIADPDRLVLLELAVLPG